MTEAFVTGSHAYGTPHDASDFDLVILCDKETKAALQTAANGEAKGQIRFGKLQILAFTSEPVFNSWKEVTDELIKVKPVTRDTAVKCFKLRMAAVLEEQYGDVTHEETATA